MRTMSDFALKRFFNQPAAATARANLSPSFAEPLGTAALLALEPGASERFAALPLNYTPAFGSLALREAIASRYGHVAPDHVLAASGGDDILPSIFMALLNPGDHVIVHSPSYQPLMETAAWCGADVTQWMAVESEGWAPSLVELRHLLRPNTRMIVTNFPHSPTGYVPDRGTLQELVGLADEAGALLVGDEIYRVLPLDGRPEEPSLADLSPRAVVANSLSKAFGLPGLRIGWLATQDAGIFDAVRRFRMYQNSFLSAPSEFLGTIALRHADTILAWNQAIARSNLALVEAFMARQAGRFSWVPPRGGVVAFPRWLGAGSTTALSDRLLLDHGLLLAPSAHFGGGERHVRIGFGTASTSASLGLLEEALGS